MSGQQQVTDERDKTGQVTQRSLREQAEPDTAGQEERWKMKKEQRAEDKEGPGKKEMKATAARGWGGKRRRWGCDKAC